MPLRFQENFVMYHADFEDRGYTATRLKQVEAALPIARTSSSLNDLRTRRTMLEWQVMLQRADDDYRARQYEQALVGYQKVSKKILALIDSRVDHLRTPSVWPEGEAVVDALVSASAELLNHLVPEHQIMPLTLQTEEAVSLDELGTVVQPTVRTAPRTSEEVSLIAGPCRRRCGTRTLG